MKSYLRYGFRTMKKRERIFLIVILQLLIAVFSTAGIFAKLASNEQMFSFRFFLFYGCMLFVLFIYAIGWQQVIKRTDLTFAYANKAVSTVWGTIWGVMLFRETVSLLKIVGMVIIITGVLIYTTKDKAEKPDER